PGVALSAGATARLRPFDLRAGRIPRADDEAALNADTATRTGYSVGDTITVLDSDQVRHRLTLTGTVGFGTSQEYSDRSVVVLTHAALARLTGDTGYQQVVAVADTGIAQATLAHRIDAALPAGARVSTGARYRFEVADQAVHQLGAFQTVLLVFALIACVVAVFVIYNTFNILVAQRVREMALLRCVGASRRQVFGSVVAEAAVVGLLGAALGTGLGLGVAGLLFRGGHALGGTLPDRSLVLSGTPIVVALLLGVLATTASALVPAYRATRIPPLAALRALPPAGTARTRRRLLLVGVAIVTVAVGTPLTVYGSTLDDPRPATLLVVAGGVVNFLAVLLLSPVFVGPLSGLLGALPGRLFGVPARLAVANARRNPGRTAATTAALTIGVGLMAAASVAVATVQLTTTHEIDSHYPVDYVVRGLDTGQHGAGVPPGVARDLRTRRDLGLVARIRQAPATIDGKRSQLATMDPTALRTLGPLAEVEAGSAHTLTSGEAVVYDSAEGVRNAHVGGRVRVTLGGRHRTFRIAAVARGSAQLGGIIVGWQDFAALHPQSDDTMVMVRAAAGAPPNRSHATVDAVLADYPTVTASSIAQWRSSLTGQIDQIITVVAALLAFAVLIALIGIMNTLSLSVLERTRESAMTRALGLTRAQLRATLLVEALLMGVVGALVGVVFGVLYGWLTSRVLFDGIRPVLTVPVGQLCGYVALAGLAAVLAAVLPARRAARSSIVAAMAET
ncbi:MAG: FtsX-like permease family protein, partial [Actinocatenispora sp.]